MLPFACHVSMRSSTYISISHVILRRREIGEYIHPLYPRLAIYSFERILSRDATL